MGQADKIPSRSSSGGTSQGPLPWVAIVLPCQQEWRQLFFHSLNSGGGATEANHPMLPEPPHFEPVMQAVQRFPLRIELGVMISNDL